MNTIKPRKRLVAEINVVPYIDVMLVLLVIFMITTPLLTQGVNVNLPEAKTKIIQSEDQTPIIVTVDRDGNYFLNVSATPAIPISPEQVGVKVAALISIAKEKNTNRPVFVKADKDIHYGQVITAMSLLQNAGAENIGLMTKPQSAA